MRRATQQDLARIRENGYEVERHGDAGWVLRDTETGSSLMIRGHGGVAPTQWEAVDEALRRIEQDARLAAFAQDYEAARPEARAQASEIVRALVEQTHPDVTWKVWNLLQTRLRDLPVPTLEIRQIGVLRGDPRAPVAELAEVEDVLWCPRCEKHTELIERDSDQRDNPVGLERTTGGPVLSADYSNTTSNWKTLVYLCSQGTHPVNPPDDVELPG